MMRRTSLHLVFALYAVLAFIPALLAPAAAAAESAPMTFAPTESVAAPVVAPPVRVASGFAIEPLALLVTAERGAVDQLDALAAWNRSGRRPLRIGLVRPLPLARTVRLGDGMLAEPAGLHAGGAFVRASPDSVVWGAAVAVDESYRLRLHLSDVELPAGARLWVYGGDGEEVAFGPELAHEGALWTPSVAGPEIRIEVELPLASLGSGDGPRFTIDQIGQIVRLAADGSPLAGGFAPKGHDSCLVDVSCVDDATFSVVDLASRGVAHLEFIDGPFIGLCTGGLLAVVDPGLAVPLLTANHCFSTPASAASLEAFWDFRSGVCDGAPPPIGSVPRSEGATLLATDVESDFTLVQLGQLPPGRVFLGWTNQFPVLPGGTVLHRLHHPVPHFDILAQQYTRYSAKSPAQFERCGTDPDGRDTDDPTKFHHTVFDIGGSFGGSSGAPLMLDDPQLGAVVVGQLFGACGPDPSDGCDPANDELDGNFARTFESIRKFLGAEPPPPFATWLSTPAVPGFDFQVRITPSVGPPVAGAREDDCIVETLCASGALAGRSEVFVRVIGPRPSGFLWVQVNRFTPSEVEVWVRQLSSDQINYYRFDAIGSDGPRLGDSSYIEDRVAFSP